MTRHVHLLQEGSLYVLLFLLPFSIAAVEIVFAVLLSCWLYERWDPRTRRETVWLRSSMRPILWGLAAFVAAAAASVLVSSHPQQSAQGLVTKWMEYLLYTVLVSDIAARPGVVKRALVVIALSACFVAYEGLTQEFWGRGLFRGHQLMVYERMTGPYTNPIDLAIYLMVISGPLLGAAAAARGSDRQAFWLVLLFTMACFGRTLALGPWVALAVACAAVLIPSDRRFRWVGAAALGLIASAAAYFLWQMRLTQAVLTLSDPGTSDRRFMWETAARMIADRPLLGHGLNTFMANYLDYWVGGERMPRYAHNCYLQMAAETGLVGLAAFLWMLWRMWAHFRGALRGAMTDERLLLVGLATGWAAFVIHAGVDTNFYSVRQSALFWVLSGLALGLALRISRGAPAGRQA